MNHTDTEPWYILSTVTTTIFTVSNIIFLFSASFKKMFVHRLTHYSFLRVLRTTKTNRFRVTSANKMYYNI